MKTIGSIGVCVCVMTVIAFFGMSAAAVVTPDAGIKSAKNDNKVAWTDSSVGLPNDPFWSVALGDVDNDAELEICAGSGNYTLVPGSGIGIWDWDGSGTWVEKSGPVSKGVFAGLVCQDFNGDGHPDLIGASMNYTMAKSVGILAWRNNGDGTWTNSSTGFPSTGQYYRIHLINISGDSALDLVACSQNGIEIYRGDGHGNWTMLTSTGLPYGDPAENTIYSSSIGDINNDGFLDIAVGVLSHDLSVWTGNGADKWTSASTGLPNNESKSYSSILLADINKDSKLDVFVGGMMPYPGVRMWMGDGTGTWTEQSSSFPHSGDYYDLKAADLDADGNNDFVAARAGYLGGLSPELEIFYSDGTGGYIKNETFAMPGYSYCVILQDINKDGRMDITASCEMGILVWHGEVPVPETGHYVLTVCLTISVFVAVCATVSRRNTNPAGKK